MTSARSKVLLVLAALAAVALVVPTTNSFVMLLATRALAFSILVMSLDILLGFTGLASLGQAAYLGIGAYLTAILATRYEFGLGYDFWLVVALGMLGSAALAALFGLLAIRATGVYFLMITLALGQCVWGLAYRWNSLTGGDNGINLRERPKFGIDLANEVTFFYLVFRVVRAFTFEHVHAGALPVRPQPGGHSRARAAHEDPGLQYLAAQISRLRHRRRLWRALRRAVGAYRRHREPGECRTDHLGRCAADGGAGRGGDIGRRRHRRRRRPVPARISQYAGAVVAVRTRRSLCPGHSLSAGRLDEHSGANPPMARGAGRASERANAGACRAVKVKTIKQRE